MKKIAFALIFFFLSSVSYAGSCVVSESAILGDWVAAAKSAPFEVMAFEKDSDGKLFNSWRHERPDYVDGKWEYANCIVQVRHAFDEKLNVEFLVIAASKNSLELRDQKQSTIFRFKRIVPSH